LQVVVCGLCVANDVSDGSLIDRQFVPEVKALITCQGRRDCLVAEVDRQDDGFLAVDGEGGNVGLEAAGGYGAAGQAIP